MKIITLTWDLDMRFKLKLCSSSLFMPENESYFTRWDYSLTKTSSLNIKFKQKTHCEQKQHFIYTIILHSAHECLLHGT